MNTTSGSAGNGLTSVISGTATYFSGGGVGSWWPGVQPPNAGSAGSQGGTAGDTNATANTGAGGGGSNGGNTGAGGSGRVVIRYTKASVGG